jgi:hypothetical protein
MSEVNTLSFLYSEAQFIFLYDFSKVIYVRII